MSMAHAFSFLRTANHLSLTTFRETGEAVPTPVWFAERAAVLYVRSGPSAGKVKRIRRTARVTVAPCTFQGTLTGPVIEGRARIVDDDNEARNADRALVDKYSIIYWGWFGLLDLRRRLRRAPKIPPVYIAVEPAG